MKYNVLLSFVLSVSFSYALQTFGQSGINDVHASIDSLVKSTQSKHNIPSMAIGIIQDGEITFQKGYGFMERASTTKVDEKTSFQIASLSKMFTGIIAHSLVIEGTLKLNESIVTYLPDEISDQDKEKLEPITLKDVLLHRAGIHRDSKSHKRKDGEAMHTPYNEADLIKDIQKVKFKRKDQYEYSNVGYAILGRILENSSGLSYEALLKKYVSEPYGLTETAVKASAPIATPYNKEERFTKTSPWNTGLMTAASGIYSSVSDLIHLMTLQLEVYRMEDEDKRLNEPLFLTKEKKLRSDGESYYGMGLWEYEFDRGILYGHSGDMDGYASQYRFNKTTNSGFVLLTSSGGDWTHELAAEVSRIIEEYAMR
jgi:CubicO group peptidase (beta-lactamase class C family)